MAVLIEGISVVIKFDRISAAFSTWGSFVDWVPNRTMCSDNELVRIGFMSPADVAATIADLEKKGLRYLSDRQAQDIAVIDQIRGLCCDCSWAAAGMISLGDDGTKQIMTARLANSSCEKLALPDGWKFEGSLTSNHRFIPTADIERSFAKVEETHLGVRTFTDHTGKKWFMGKTNDPRH